MTMLREALSPSVRDCLARYILDPSLYFEALSELKRTYGDPFLLANIYLQELDSLPLVPDDDPRALLAFVDSVHEIIYGLAKAKLHHELNSYWILIRLASKLPERLRYDWTAKMISLEKQNIRPHVGHFVECIDQMADVARIEITFRIN